MKIVLNFEFKKILPFATFTILLVKVCLSIVAMVNAGIESESIEGLMSLASDFLDVALWAMIAQWFLHVYLYMSKVIGSSSLRHSTTITIIFAMVKCLSVCVFSYFLLHYSLWSVFYAVIECVAWLVFFAYLFRTWIRISKESKKHHPKKKEYYTLKDELARKGGVINPFK